MPHLQYTVEGKVERFTLRLPITTIGSGDDCHLRLNAQGVAAAHCNVVREPGKYTLEASDRSSVFFVRGKKTRKHELRHGDVLTIGTAELTFSAVDDVASSKDDAPLSSVQSRVAAMQQLVEFSEMLAKPLPLTDLLDELIDQVVSLTRAHKGFLVLATNEDAYEVKVARNLERQPVDSPDQLLSDNIIRSVITSKKAQIISDALNDDRYQNSLSVINLKVCSVMCVPLLVRGELLGLIYVGNNDIASLFQSDQLELLKVFAAQAALFLKSAIVVSDLRREKEELAERLEDQRFGEIVGACPQMIEVYRLVDKVASTNITVLVTGETGTGKELIAQEIHTRSDRRGAPIVAVNCGAIPETLIESELFGHVRGAFTGAIGTHVGKFEAANGGTLFLDEIGELPLSLQVKLLRVLETRTIQRLGDTKTLDIDVRVVAATHRNLAKEVKEGRFREDLFFRLNVISIQLPPLRDRGEDVVFLARYFVGRYAKEFGKSLDPGKALGPEAQGAIRRFGWPGNIRQLQNHIKKAIVLADQDVFTPKDLELDNPAVGGTSDGEFAILPLADAREQWQMQYVNRVLALNNGNRTQTARDLGVDPRTIFRYLEKE